jgi:predicted RNase H-like HicB family nuclease
MGGRVEGGEVMKIAVILTPCEEGGFSARVPTLSGCFGEGETVEEALIDIQQAIELHIEAVEDDLVVEDEEQVFELVWHASRPSPDIPGPGSIAESVPNSLQAPSGSPPGFDRAERRSAVPSEPGTLPRPGIRPLRPMSEDEGSPE